MKGFSYLYTLFFVSFLSLIVVSYFTNVSVSYLSQKGGLNIEYYNSISREFLSMVLNQIIKKINYYPSKIDSIEELGIVDGAIYLLKIKEISSQVKIKIIDEKIKKEVDYNTIEFNLRITVNPNLMNIDNGYYADLKLSIISGKLPYYFFQPTGDTIDNIFIFPFHNQSLYNKIKPNFSFDIKNLLKTIFGQDKPIDYSILRESLNLDKKINMPVVDGLYVGEIKGENYLYFKGKIDEIILGKDNDYQFIYAAQGDNSLIFEYNNQSADIIITENSISKKIHGRFNSNILIDGDIDSISSGKTLGSEIIKDSDAPAVRDDETINFIVAGSIKIDSSLKYEGISVEKGRFKREKTKLNFIQSAEKFFEDEKTDNQTFVFGNELHGNYYFSGGLFIDNILNIFGNIYSKSRFYNRVKVIEDPLNYSMDMGNNFPKTKNNFTIIKDIKLIEIGEKQ